eukprot:2294617-Pyramimonas_sp.AAC.1
MDGYRARSAPSHNEDYVRPSSPAEFHAALWFVCWLLQAPSIYRSRRTVVRSDNLMVVETAAGGPMYRYCGALPIRSDSLVKLARVRTVLTWLHVPSHAAYPLNELVDARARRVSIKDIADRPEDAVPWSILLSYGQGSMVMVDGRRPP